MSVQRHARVVSTGEIERIAQTYARRGPSRHDQRYSLFQRGTLFATQERERQLLALLARRGLRTLTGLRVLEIGCGSGYWLREFVKWGAAPECLAGVDLLNDRLAEARSLCASAVHLGCCDASALPFHSEVFDLVLQSTVFTSILDAEMRELVAAEMLRVVRREGIIVWYDFHVDNPFNRDVRRVTKREVKRLFPDCDLDFRRVTLAPPLARVVAAYSWPLCQVLSAIPYLRTHFIGTIKKK